MIYTQKNINIHHKLHSQITVDLYLQQDEVIIFAKFICYNLLIFINYNTKIINYDIQSSEYNIKNISKKYRNAYLLGQDFF